MNILLEISILLGAKIWFGKYMLKKYDDFDMISGEPAPYFLEHAPEIKKWL